MFFGQYVILVVEICVKDFSHHTPLLRERKGIRMMCPKCGKNLEGSIVRCPDCGVELDVQYSPVMMTGGKTKSSFTPTNFIMKTTPVGRSGKRTAIWWIAAALLVAMMAAAVIFAFVLRANPQLFG